MTDRIEIFRNMTPDQRVRIACELHDFAYRRVFLSIQEEHPEWTEEECKLETAVRFLGESARVLRARSQGA